MQILQFHEFEKKKKRKEKATVKINERLMNDY